MLGRLVIMAFLAGCAPEPKTWSYEKPAAWKDVCASGRQQSPVDLRVGRADKGTPLELGWQPTPLTAKHSGHTIQFDVGPGSHVGELQLKQFHFHVPGEHAVDGKHAAMELHLVHVDAQGQAAMVIAVQVVHGAKPDAGNMTAYAMLARALPQHEGEVREYQRIDLQQLLPPGRARYEYDGSLTTPPCSEGVHWIVMAEPVALDQAVLDAFTSVPHVKGTARPTQPLHDRQITLSR
jgi:carbonic anhydrase